MKKSFKIVLIILIIIYLCLFLSYKNGYYVKKNEENMLFTEEKIREYEEDLKNGVDVSKKDYLDVKESHDNKYTRFILKLSHTIENGFDKTIKYIFNKINGSINN